MKYLMLVISLLSLTAAFFMTLFVADAFSRIINGYANGFMDYFISISLFSLVILPVLSLIRSIREW